MLPATLSNPDSPESVIAYLTALATWRSSRRAHARPGSSATVHAWRAKRHRRGWVVQVVTWLEGATPVFRYFNVAIADSDQALAAVQSKAGVTRNARLEVVRGVVSSRGRRASPQDRNSRHENPRDPGSLRGPVAIGERYQRLRFTRLRGTGRSDQDMASMVTNL
jgi:hypothetical protein